MVDLHNGAEKIVLIHRRHRAAGYGKHRLTRGACDVPAAVDAPVGHRAVIGERLRAEAAKQHAVYRTDELRSALVHRYRNVRQLLLHGGGLRLRQLLALRGGQDARAERETLVLLRVHNGDAALRRRGLLRRSRDVRFLDRIALYISPASASNQPERSPDQYGAQKKDYVEALPGKERIQLFAEAFLFLHG